MSEPQHLWAWICPEDDDGIIASEIPGIGVITPMVFKKRELAEVFAPIIFDMVSEVGRSARLVRFDWGADVTGEVVQ